MEVNSIIKIEDGVESLPQSVGAPSIGEGEKPSVTEGTVKKKRRRGKSKRKVMKPYIKLQWQKRRNEKCKRNNGFRKIVLRKSHAPYNNNQFLMEIHKPEPENNFQLYDNQSARTRDSSFSVDSEDNYFFSLPADEEEFLTKEFSSVYEEAQCERLASLSKNEIIQEFLALESKYEKLIVKCKEQKENNDDKDTTGTDIDTTVTDGDSMSTEQDTTGASLDLTVTDDCKYQDIVQRVKEQEEIINVLKQENNELRSEIAHLHKSYNSSSADSESDSSSTSVSSSSTNSRCGSPDQPQDMIQEAQPIYENGIENSEELTENGVEDPECLKE